MTSNSIYIQQVCFVYKWTQLSTSKWYIGSHYSKTAHPNDGYICTSEIVKPMILDNPADWIREILETGSAEDMITLEFELLTCLGAAKSEYSYNGHNGDLKFYTAGLAKGKYAKGKSRPSNMGKAAKGILRGPSKGKASKGTPKPKSECYQCFKSFDAANLKRWHGDNCKIFKEVPLSNKIPKTGLKARGMPSTGKAAKGYKESCPRCNILCSPAMLKRWHGNNCKM